MQSLIAQLQAAGVQAAKLSDEAKAAAEHKAAWQRLARQRQWESRRAENKVSLLDIITNLLPADTEGALTGKEIAARLASLKKHPTGLASALSRLIRKGRIARTGDTRPYRYFNPYKEAA